MEVVNPSKKYTSVKNLVFSCQYHVIFCPKYRRSVLTDNIAKRLKELILEKQLEYNYKIIVILNLHLYLRLICTKVIIN